MPDQDDERRQYKRYNTEVKIYFDFAFDLQTKVEFEVVDPHQKKSLSGKYTAISRNISVEGICIVTDKALKKGDILMMQLYLPSTTKPIDMQGEVRWCSPSKPEDEARKAGEDVKFLAGVLLSKVQGKDVKGTIHYDEEYKVDWSIVLESVFGSYKLLMGGKYKKDSK